VILVVTIAPFFVGPSGTSKIFSNDNVLCDTYQWTPWGDYMPCVMTEEFGCVKARYRSCICNLNPVSPTNCISKFGDSDVYIEHCDNYYCSKGPTERLLVMEIPAYGPNNQYIGFKETMFFAKFSNRTLAVPEFKAHRDNSIKTFQSTFEIERIREYVPAITLKTFIDECKNKIHYLVWMRWSTIHRNEVYSYLKKFNLTVLEEEDVPRNLESKYEPTLENYKIKNV
jgi:hypothetical protein